MLAELDALLARKNQRFICHDTGWPEPTEQGHTALITHEAGPALNEEALAALREQIPEVPALAGLYARHGSIRLFCDTVFHAPWGGRSSAFYIAHPDEWAMLQEEFNAWLDGLSPEEEEELLPAWLQDHVVIGEIPNSGNYFLLALKGEDAGSVFEFEHDGFEFLRQGRSVEEFIAHLCTVNDALLRDIRGHTRYFDGKTDTQWLAERYEYD